ncbi:MAG: tetratricopeptide repeat protein [Candidatus Latescibacteria bacterium]|nr:tetratricopeptide repeat protein [Candidatus Latescibacterota bacterium]
MTIDRAIRLCLYAALLATPLVFDPGLYHVFVLDKAVLLRALVSAGTVLWAVKAVRGEGWGWRRTGLDRGVLVVLIAALVATTFSASSRISLIGSSTRQEGLVALVNDLLLFYLAFRFLKDRPQRVAGMVCLAGVLAAGYGILQRLGGDPLSWSEPVWARVTSTFGQPNALGAYLGMALPMILALGMTRPEGKVQNEKCNESSLCTLHFALCTFYFLVVGIGLLLTGSRGGWMGAGAGLTLFGALTWPVASGSARRQALFCAALMVVVTGVFCLNPGLSPVRRIGSTVQIEYTGEGRSVSFDGTARERLVTWRASWKMFLDHPLSGVGPEMMREFLPRSLSAEDPETEADRAHNLLLHEAATKGLIGLGALVYLLVALFRAGAFSQTVAGEGRILSAGFLSAILCYVVQGFVGFGWPATTALFWVAAAMVVGPHPQDSRFRVSDFGSSKVEVRSSNEDSHLVIRHWAIRNLGVALLIVFALANAGLAVAAYRADLMYAKGIRLMEAGEIEAALSACRSAGRTYPMSSEYLAGLGLLSHRAAERTGDGRRLPEAEAAMAGAVGMDPEDGHLWAWLGMIRAARFRARGDTTLALAAAQAYREAVRRVPKNAGVFINLSNLFVETGQSAEAVRVCEEGAERNPRSTEILTALGRVHQARGEGEAAARAFRRVVVREPANEAAHQALGRIAFERGDFEGAAEAYRTAAELGPESAARQNDLGSALFRAGRPEEAAQAFRAALRIAPGDAYAREVLEAIPARDSVRAEGTLPEVPRLPREAVIDLRDPAHRRYLRQGWSYTETWGTWGTGEASEVVFSLKGVAEGALIVRATAPSRPDPAQGMVVVLNDRLLARWTFTRPAWDWETFRVRVPAGAFLRGVNRLTFRYARHGPATQEDPRPVAVAFEKIALGPP